MRGSDQLYWPWGLERLVEETVQERNLYIGIGVAKWPGEVKGVLGSRKHRDKAMGMRDSLACSKSCKSTSVALNIDQGQELPEMRWNRSQIMAGMERCQSAR